MNDPQQPVTLVDLLDRLADVPAPAAVSMFPQTWGWAVLGVFVAFALAWLVVVFMRRYRKNAYRRAALLELDAAGDDTIIVANIVRRSALTAYPRTRVARLYGEDWLEFLEATGNGLTFRTGPGASLGSPLYRGVGVTPGIGKLAASWVRKHPGGTGP